MHITFADVLTGMSMIALAGNAWVMMSLKTAISELRVEIYKDFVRKDDRK